MFYRRKLILALIESLGGSVEKLTLHKLLFLISQQQEKPTYEFIPYKFGCYSFSVNADMIAMIKHEYIHLNDNEYSIITTSTCLPDIKPVDSKILNQIISFYEGLNISQLIKHTYIQFPFYAINSTIADELLDHSQLQRVEMSRPLENEIVLFTLGYEGISLEKYLLKLIKNNIKLLVDVRKNPLSMKYGFSKSRLKKYCQSVGIDYIHIPEVGIVSSKRKQLYTQQDYDNLFSEYTATTLHTTLGYQDHILHLLKNHRRIALTCFESESNKCHRKHLALSLQSRSIFNFPISHL